MPLITLTKSVITQLCVYWEHIYYIPVAIINKLNRIMAHYLQAGGMTKHKYHLTKLDNITTLKWMGDQGILDLLWFRSILLQKEIWRGIFGEGIWSNIVKHKYLKDLDFSIWFHQDQIGTSMGSTIWHSFKKYHHYFLQNLCWVLGAGHQTLIDHDFILGISHSITFTEALIQNLHNSGIFYQNQLISAWNGQFFIWCIADEFGFLYNLAGEWYQT